MNIDEKIWWGYKALIKQIENAEEGKGIEEYFKNQELAFKYSSDFQTYGFTPAILPESMNFSQLIHAANERIPIKALEFGADCIFKLLQGLV